MATIQTVDNAFLEKLIKIAEELSLAYNEYGHDRDRMFNIIVNCALNTEIGGKMDNTQRLILGNHIMNYVMKDALCKGILSPEDSETKFTTEQYMKEKIAIFSLRKNIKYSDKLHNVFTLATNHVVSAITPYMPDMVRHFSYAPLDTKLLFADYISEHFMSVARSDIWDGLKDPIITHDPVRRTAYATAYTFKDMTHAVQTQDVTQIEVINLIGISEYGLQQNMVDFSSTIVHECVHDVFNQIASELHKPVPNFGTVAVNFRDDFKIFVGQRIITADLSRFPLLYQTDFEEALCHHAENVLEYDLKRFLPSHQITYTP